MTTTSSAPAQQQLPPYAVALEPFVIAYLTYVQQVTRPQQAQQPQFGQPSFGQPSFGQQQVQQPQQSLYPQISQLLQQLVGQQSPQQQGYPQIAPYPQVPFGFQPSYGQQFGMPQYQRQFPY